MKSTNTIFLAFTLNTAAFADYYRALADEFVHRGYQVVIITDGNRTQKISENSNPAIYTWPSSRPTRFVDARFFGRLIRQWKPVMSFSNFGADNINLLVSWLSGVPLRFVSYHTMLDPEIMKKPKSLAFQLRVLRKSLVYRLATSVLPVAEAMKSELIGVYKVPHARIKAFHNAIVAHPEMIQKGLSTNSGLISAGALVKGKGHDVLIKAMAEVVKKHPDLHLTIYGEGPERTNLEGLIQSLKLGDIVKLPGAIPHANVICSIAESYALVHPSRFEAFGYSIIEAFSVGTPVIASAVGGIPEIIREGVDGFLVPPDDPALFADRISHLCSNTQLRYEMSQNCQARFMEAFEVNRAVQKQADWFESKMSLVEVQ